MQSLKPNFIREMKEGMAVLRQNKGLYFFYVGTLYMFVYMPITSLYPLITMPNILMVIIDAPFFTEMHLPLLRPLDVMRVPCFLFCRYLYCSAFPFYVFPHNHTCSFSFFDRTSIRSINASIKEKPIPERSNSGFVVKKGCNACSRSSIPTP